MNTSKEFGELIIALGLAFGGLCAVGLAARLALAYCTLFLAKRRGDALMRQAYALEASSPDPRLTQMVENLRRKSI